MAKLFLDDIRSPPDDNWVVVRSFQEFRNYILNNRMPDVISFDHDLGVDEDGLLLPTGMDCAKWLVAEGFGINEFLVHSANPVGRANIYSLLNQWRLYCNRGA